MKQNMDTKLHAKNILFPEIVFVDGLTRSGKMLMGELISHIARVDYFMFSVVIDHIPVLWHLQHLEKESAVAFLRVTLDSLIIDRAMGRNLNTRKNDSTSILRANDPDEYLKRTTEPGAKLAVDRFIEAGRIPSFLTHHMLSVGDLLFHAAPQARLIEIARHPVDLVDAWMRRGWGKRETEDPLAIIINVDRGDYAVPWYGVDWADEFVNMEPIDRNIHLIANLSEKTQTVYDDLDDAFRKAVHFISLERFVTHPWEEMQNVAAFLGSELSETITSMFEAENLPRESEIEARQTKWESIQQSARPESLERLLESSRHYETTWGLEALC